MKPNSILAFVCIFLAASQATIAQTNTFPSTGAAGIGTTTPNASSLLDIVSNSKGILIPRMTKTKRDSIALPATGLLIYQTNSTPGFYYYSGSAWTALSPKGVNKSLNNLTATAVNQSLVPGVNDSIDLGASSTRWRHAYLSGNAIIGGNVGIGTTAPNAALQLGSVIGNRRIVLWESTNNDHQFYGFGINGSTLRYQVDATSSAHVFFAANSASTSVELMRIKGNGDVGIGTSSPAAKLDVNGNASINGEALISGLTVGKGSGASATNTALGYQALYINSTGTNNVASGNQALRNNSTGSDNVANGYNALISSTSSYNTAMGSGALFKNTSGGSNTATGYWSLFTNTTGSGNSAFGFEADVSSNNLTNATALGWATTVNASNKVRIGNANVTVVESAVGSWTTSDGRFKTNIKEEVKGLAFIKLLRPVVYNFDAGKFDEFLMQNYPDSIKQVRRASMNKESTSKISAIRQSGFIAQEVAEAVKKSGYDFNGVHAPENPTDNWSLSYEKMVVPLVKAVQELSKMNDEKDAKINDLESRLAKLEAIMNTQNVMGSQQAINLAGASLQQNVPNPFNHTTTIAYTLPQQYSSAKIVVTNKAGAVLKEISVSANGKGSLQVDATTLAAGAYNYSLYVDGKLINSRQMVLTK